MIDKNSPTWSFIAERIQTRLQEATKTLKSEVDFHRTTQMRERIRAFEDVLTWADEAPDTPDEGIEFQL